MNNAKTIVLITFILIFSSTAMALKNHSLPAPYNSINILNADYDGWLSEVNQKGLKRFIETLQPKIVVEIGSWLGLSAIFMALSLPSESKLYAVDHWQGSIEHHMNQEWSVKLPTLYHQFLSNVIHAGVTHKIIPARMSSLEAAKTLSVKPNLVYIDGSHKEIDVYNDIIAWYEKLEIGGILCGDDYSWGNQAIGGFVYNGVLKAAKELNMQVIVEGDIFWYLPPKK